MSSLFCRTHCCGFNASMECQIQLSFKDLTFYIGYRGVIVSDFFTIFANKIFNIDVESIKIITKMQNMDRTTKKILEDENFGQN